MRPHAQISVSNRCNLRCKMCDIGQRDEEASGLTHNIQREEELPATRWIEILKSLDVGDVHIVGVEPLLYKELDVLLEGLGALGCTSYVTTNGFLLNEERAKMLAHHCKRVDVSIDGPNPAIHDSIRGVNGSFDRAYQGARMLVEEGVTELNISCAITPENAQYLQEMYELFHEELGVGISFSHYNYIAPESCAASGCSESNMGYDPRDVDLRAVRIATKKCKGAVFFPLLKNRWELKAYYQTAPTKPIKARCAVVDGTLAGQRYVIAPDGTFLIGARCWYSSDIGSALDGDIPAESPVLKALADEIARNGLPAACQRLCCAGKTV